MPLLFLITYIALSYFIYKKNKDKVEKIPLIIQLTGLIPFGLLLVFIVYYSEISFSVGERELYFYSFYFLVISYLITYIAFIFKYKSILNNYELKEDFTNNIGTLEEKINKIFFYVIIFVSGTYFLYTNIKDVSNDDGTQILLYLFFVFSSIFILFKNKILSINK